jgi:hypothetical protein
LTHCSTLEQCARGTSIFDSLVTGDAGRKGDVGDASNVDEASPKDGTKVGWGDVEFGGNRNRTGSSSTPSLRELFHLGKAFFGKLQFDPNSINELIFIGVVRVIGMALYSEIRDSNKTMSHVRALYIEPSEEQRWFAILNQLEIGIRSLRPDGPLERTNDLRSQ